MIRLGWATLVLPLVVTAQSAAQPSGLVRTREMPPVYAEAAREGQLKRFERPDERADAAYALIANKTRLVASPGSPLQVAYTAPTGAVFLWFPESGASRRGRWYIEERRVQLLEGGKAVKASVHSAICFDYSGGVPNILAPEWQRNPLCSPTAGVRARTLDQRAGDLLGLAAGRPLKPLGPVGARTLEDLVRRL
jgi:hypothetical protein